MFDRNFGIFLGVLSAGLGILLLSGHGSFLLKGGNEAARKKDFDEKKLERGSGVALTAFGAVTFIDAFTSSMAAKIAYLVAMIAIFGLMIWYIRTKCRK